MTTFRLKYVHRFRDHNGHLRHYFRRHGKRTPLPGLPGSDAFMEAYRRALAGLQDIGAAKVKAGTVAAAVAGYLGSSAFSGLAPDTRRVRRRILEKLRDRHGGKMVDGIGRELIIQALADRTPTSGRKFLAALSALMEHSVALGLRTDNPCLGLKRPRVPKTDGHYTWTEGDVTTFRVRWPLGTKQRLALELLAGTGQRRGDVIRMGRQHVRDGILSIRQSKTGVLVEIPVLSELGAAIDAMPSEHLTFLVTEYGKPFTAAGFGNWFRDQRVATGLKKGSAHGLRKYAATRHAESGATAHQLMAWFGWETLAEAERYTRAADRRRLATQMAEKLSGTQIGNSSDEVAKSHG